MKNKRNKELLLFIQNKTVEEQGSIVVDYCTEWSAKNEQLDDVLVIGKRFMFI